MLGNQQAYSSFMPQTMDSGATRPFRPGAQQEEKGGPVAGVITPLIILATLLLLGFSVYLAASLNFISLPFFNGNNPNSNPVTTPTPQTGTAPVPNLVNMNCSHTQHSPTNTPF